ncbi:hypothetical protein D3C72_1983820 [compost metagenome]
MACSRWLSRSRSPPTSGSRPSRNTVSRPTRTALLSRPRERRRATSMRARTSALTTGLTSTSSAPACSSSTVVVTQRRSSRQRIAAPT